jgi:hypothetical protein
MKLKPLTTLTTLLKLDLQPLLPSDKQLNLSPYFCTKNMARMARRSLLKCTRLLKSSIRTNLKAYHTSTSATPAIYYDLRFAQLRVTLISVLSLS